MKKSFKTLVALAAIALLFPASLAFAKENGNSNNDKKESTKTERRENRVSDKKDSDKVVASDTEQNEVTPAGMVEAAD